MPLILKEPDPPSTSHQNEPPTAHSREIEQAAKNDWLDDICIARNIIVNSRFVTMYGCNQCKREYKHPSKLKEHYRVHSGERPFECEICNKRFSQKGALKCHIRTHSEERPFTCHFCPFAFGTSSQRTRHEKTIHEDVVMINTLDPPPILSPQRPNLEEEDEDFWEETNYEYEEPGPSTLNAHEEDIPRMETPAVEEIPRFMVKTTNPADSSQSGGNGEEEYVEVLVADALPPLIGRRRNENEIEKVLISTSVFDLAAPRSKGVPKTIKKRERKKKIIREEDKDASIDLVVNAVSKGVHTDEIFPRSIRSSVVKECEYCGKRLKYPSRIEEHMRTHTKEKPFICPICNTGFAQQTTMRMHLRRHINHRPFACQYPGCESSFVNGGLLNIHIQEVHQRRRRFACLNDCGKVFRSNTARQRHETEACPFRTEIEVQDPQIEIMQQNMEPQYIRKHHDEELYDEDEHDDQEGYHELVYDDQGHVVGGQQHQVVYEEDVQVVDEDDEHAVYEGNVQVNEDSQVVYEDGQNLEDYPEEYYYEEVDLGDPYSEEIEDYGQLVEYDHIKVV